MAQFCSQPLWGILISIPIKEARLLLSSPRADLPQNADKRRSRKNKQTTPATNQRASIGRREQQETKHSAPRSRDGTICISDSLMNDTSFLGFLAVTVGSTQRCWVSKGGQCYARYALDCYFCYSLPSILTWFFPLCCVIGFFVLFSLPAKLLHDFFSHECCSYCLHCMSACGSLFLMRLLHKSEGCLLPGESDESDKDAMLKSVGGGCRLYLEAKSEVAEAPETHLLLLFSRTPLKILKSKLFSEAPSENNSGEVGLDATWAKERQGKKRPE